MSKMLDAALAYCKAGYPVIPIRLDLDEHGKPLKKAHVPWTEYQTRLPTEDEIKSWWTKWPDDMIGIVTGKISGLFILDLDPGHDPDNIEQYLPDSLLTPTVLTPREGKHLYFKAPDVLLSGVRDVFPFVDTRCDGNYIIAPPSVNGNNKAYRWLVKLSEAPLASIPDALYKFLLSSSSSLYKVDKSGDVVNCRQSRQVSPKFSEPGRDETLFHLANYLVKGNMPIDNIKEFLYFFADHCNPPIIERLAEEKIESALKRAKTRHFHLKEDIREYILSSSGVILSSDCRQCLQLSSREDIKNMSKIFRRFCEEPEKLLEPYGGKNGQFRRLESDIEMLDIINAPTDEYKVNMPLGLTQLCKLYPGNICVASGSKSAGKTAFLLNVARLSLNTGRKIMYMSSESGETELRIRCEAFGLTAQQWIDGGFVPIIRNDGWHDVIDGTDTVWIIDYYEPPEEKPWMIGTFLRKAHEKMRGKGICFAGIQKPTGRDEGTGGRFTKEKSRLYVALDWNKEMKKNIIKIVDCKAPRGRNPRDMWQTYEIMNKGSKYVLESGWKESE